jgi:hypothetical protein
MLFKNFSNWRYYLSPIATISVWQSPFHNGLLLAAIELGIGAIRVEWKKLGIELDEQHAEGIWSSYAEFRFGFIQLVPISPGLLLPDILPLQGFVCTRARRHATPSRCRWPSCWANVSLASAWPIHFLLEVIRWRRAWPIIFVLQVIRSSRGVNNPRGLSTCLTPSRCPWKSLMKGFEGLPCYQLLRPTGPLHQHLLTSDITRRWWSSL